MLAPAYFLPFTGFSTLKLHIRVSSMDIIAPTWIRACTSYIGCWLWSYSCKHCAKKGVRGFAGNRAASGPTPDYSNAKLLMKSPASATPMTSRSSRHTQLRVIVGCASSQKKSSRLPKSESRVANVLHDACTKGAGVAIRNS